MKSHQDKPDTFTLGQWAENLEAGKRNDPELEIAARMQAAPLPVPAIPLPFKAELRERLLEQAGSSSMRWVGASTVWNWVLSGAALVALLAILILSQRLLPSNEVHPPYQAASGIVDPEEQTPGFDEDTLGLIGPQEMDSAPDAEAAVPLNDESWEIAFAADPRGIEGLPLPPLRDRSVYLDYANATNRLYLASREGDRLAYLAGGPYERSILLGFSPDGQKALVYSYDDVFFPPDVQNGPAVLWPQNSLLYAVNLDGSEPLALSTSFRAQMQDPYRAAFWLPDSERIALIDVDEDGLGVFSMGVDGQERIRLSPVGVEPLWLLPAASLDGVYWQEGRWTPVEEIMERGPVDDLSGFWWSALDGSHSNPVWQGLDDLAGSAAQPVVALSPAGERLALINRQCQQGWGDEETCRRVHITNLAGEWLRDLQFPGNPTTLVWSPDGTRLLVEVWSVQGEDIGMVFYLWSGEDEPVRLPDELETWLNATYQMGPAPQWSPDGKYILFEGDRRVHPRVLDVETFAVHPALQALDIRNVPGEVFSVLQWVP